MVKIFLLFLLLILAQPPAHSVANSEALARQLLNSQGCKACHRFEGSGGNFGPPLDQVGKNLNAEAIRKQLSQSPKPDSDTGMPSFSHLKPEQLEALATFLAATAKE